MPETKQGKNSLSSPTTFQDFHSNPSIFSQTIKPKNMIAMQLSLPLYLIFLSTFSSSLPLPLPQPNNNITLYGDALFTYNGFSLTQETTCLPPSSPSHIGRALYANPIRFLDLQTKPIITASFSCTFSFSILPNPVCPFGDGFVFLIASDADHISFGNGHMGLPQLDHQLVNSQDSYFAVEFDTSFDPSVSDINGNHIGIDVDTVVSIGSVDVISKGVDLTSGKKITAWIEYRDSSKLVLVWVSYSSTKPQSPVLVAQIDLSSHLKEYMYVGFSASNGQGSAMHIVEHWQFKTYSTYEPPSLSPVDVDTVEERNLSLSDDPQSSPHNKGVVLGCLVASVVFVTTIPLCFFVVRKNKDLLYTRSSSAKSTRSVQPMNNVPTRWSLEEIKSATSGFHRNRVVGKGASAVVYKGYIPSVGTVAVKRFESNQTSNGKGFDRNLFSTEFAVMSGCLNHCNLVRLQGWCCEGSELVLVYEYLPNGSLDRHIHNKNSTFLSWNLRLKVILGVASALTFLHEECERQIIHRDVKTCNIMLDDEFNAKLGDFGLAEVYEHCSAATREATVPAGTIGYLAPEYVYSGIPTVKTDVYGFGVVVLELATGKRPVDENRTVLVDWVWDLWVKKELLEAADSKLSGRYNVLEMERMLLVGLCCVHPNHEKRPTVKEAAQILRREAALPVLPSMRPSVSLRSNVSGDCGDNNTTNDEAGWSTPRSHFSKVRH